MPAKQDPSPEEIAAACREIQAGWTPAERLKRLRADLRPSYIRADGVREDIAAADYAQHHAQHGELELCHE